jgi:hypothetical protein
MPSLKIKIYRLCPRKKLILTFFRFYGSYENLESGLTADALIDMSGRQNILILRKNY